MDFKQEVLTNLNFNSFYRGEIKNLGKQNGDGWALGLCCFHPDTNPSLSINTNTGKYKCFSCGSNGDIFTFYQKKYDCDFKEALNGLAKIAGIDTSKKEQPKKQIKNTKSRVVATYVYTDKTGKPLHRTVKTDQKDFFQEHLDAKGNWIKGVKGVQLVLYNLPKVINSSDVYFVEGERDCEALSKLGFCATTNPMGAGKLPRQQEKHAILDPLTGKRVFAIADNDKAGKAHVEQLAELLHGKAKEVRIVDLPGLEEGQDVSDFIQKLGDKAKTKLIELTAIAPVWAPPKNFLSADELLATTFEKKTPIISKGIMPHNSHIIISGETGIGKSLLRLELALHLVMGWEWLGFEIPTARKVSIFQFENMEAMEKTRLKRMCSGLGIGQMPKGRLSYVDRKNRVNLTLKRDREKLLELVKQSEAEVIIYDCLSNLHSAKENDNIQMRDVLDSLTEINAKVGTSCILIHHFGKPTEWQETRYRTRGAQSIIDWSVTAMAFTVRKHEHKILRQLEFIKVRDGAEPKPILLERDENFLLSITDEDSLCPASKVKEILEDLGGEVERQGELIEAIIGEVGCSVKSAKRYIQNAVKMEAIIEIDHGHGKKKQYQI